eukprot:Filipodium_phascolosomae@DN2029_c2_g1_i1.p1
MWLNHFDFVVAPEENDDHQWFDNVCSVMYVDNIHSLLKQKDVASSDSTDSAMESSWDPLLFKNRIENTFVKNTNKMGEEYHCKWLKYWLTRLKKLVYSDDESSEGQTPWDWMADETDSPAHEAFPYVL